MHHRSTLALLASIALIAPASAQVGVPTGTLVSTTSTTGDKFGEAVAADGDVLVVGARAYSQVTTTAGAATVFERQPDGSWLETATLLPPTPTLLGFFGDTVAVEGDTIFVAETEDDTFGADQGAVHVYRRQPDGTWPQVQVLGPPTPSSLASFGSSLSVDSGRLAVGNNDGAFTEPYAAVIFAEQQDGTWALEAEILAPPSLENQFGSSVALAGDWLVVGATDWTSGQSARAFVFRRQGGGIWPLHSILQPNDMSVLQHFGTSVAALEVNGDLLVAVSATNNGDGAVDLFEALGAGGWNHLQRIVAPTPDNTTFGYALELEAQRLFVSDPNWGLGVSGYGRVWVYERTAAAQWEPSTVLDHGKGEPREVRLFGWDLAKAGSTLFVGEPGFGGPSSSEVGEVRVFESDTLFQSSNSISVGAGGSVDLLLAAGVGEAGNFHLVLGSVSGTAPGLPLGPGLVLPLVPDVYTDMTLAGGGGVLTGGFGQLDSLGAGGASFGLPAASDPALVGVVAHHAVVTLDATPQLTSVSGASQLELVP